ncbi:hypothetical protein [Parasedimentitalea psychrophila]|uniref:Uncharacterized protein n=1 Tax=Parasedimentitalea psychrophila TaxID=2997337 RepID=A0A9Y2P0Z5_9RHOB|nr:hypothetical protein [Parasedimentitalea psychrophila]WIY23642.1 hypothetical protein QPJ95_13390 [Parasedimentitalea psychrophila]
MPSHQDISEIAIKMRTSEQLNGQVDSLSAIVLQMAPVRQDFTPRNYWGFKGAAAYRGKSSLSRLPARRMALAFCLTGAIPATPCSASPKFPLSELPRLTQKPMP